MSAVDLEAAPFLYDFIALITLLIWDLGEKKVDY